MDEIMSLGYTFLSSEKDHIQTEKDQNWSINFIFPSHFFDLKTFYYVDWT